MELDYDIEIGEDAIKVTLEGELETINPSYDDAFGTVVLDSYTQLVDFPTWDKSNFNFQENWIIAIYIYYNFLSIEKLFCDLEFSFVNNF